MPDENNPSPVPTPAPVPPENPNPPVQAPPPAASLVQNGDVTDERQIAWDREREALLAEKRKLETDVSERERDIQELRTTVNSPAPAPKRKRAFSTIIGSSDEDSNE